MIGETSTTRPIDPTSRSAARRSLCLVILGALLFTGCASGPLASENPPSTKKIRIVLVGDSTVNDQGGWGAGFKQLIDDRIECVNYARNGRSSKSFIEEGHWAQALAGGADYVLIQFGHNDMPEDNRDGP